MKKILIFSLGYYPKHVGGAEVAIKEITDRIDTHDIEFHMIALRYDSTLPKVEKIGNVLVHRIGFTLPNPAMADLVTFPLHLNKFVFQLSAALKAMSLHRKYKYQAIWAMMAHSCGIPAGIFKFFNKDVPYLLTLQEGDPIEYIERKMSLVKPLFKRSFTEADMVQVISTFLSKWACNMGFKGPIEIIPNAVNTAHFSKQFNEKEMYSVQRDIGKNEGDIYIVTTSRLVHKNAVDDVVSSLPDLPENIKFLIFGTGPDENFLKNLAKEKKVEKRVIFWGQIDHKVMPKYLKACDIFIRPSRSEGMGNSFVEAFAAELPVIATQEGGISDFLFDAKRNPDRPTTGFAVDKDSPKQISEAVMRILDDPEKTKEVVKNAKKLALAKYDWNIIANDMENKVFNKLLS